MRPVNHIWNLSAFAALCSRGGVAVIVNIHKRCAQGELSQPFEAVRAAQVLGAGGLLVSQRAHPRDEAAFAGLVDFFTLEQLPGALAALLAEPDLDLRAAARSRDFRERFAPALIFQRAHFPHDDGGTRASQLGTAASSGRTYDGGSHQVPAADGATGTNVSEHRGSVVHAARRVGTRASVLAHARSVGPNRIAASRHMPRGVAASSASSAAAAAALPLAAGCAFGSECCQRHPRVKSCLSRAQ